MRNRFNLTIVLGALTGIAGAILLVIREDIAFGLNLERPMIISITASFLLLYGIGFLLYAYLQFNRRIEYKVSDYSIGDSSIREELELLKLEILKSRNKDAHSKVDEEEIGKLIKSLINQNLESEQFLKAVEAKFGTQLAEEQKILRINRDFESINQRIGFEIARLSKSANINLVFGSLSTLFAIGFLGYEVLYNPVKFSELIPLLSHYIPRIAIVVFVEVFAFFFLKIYKANLNDIKYFHNEKTNIDLKLIAIKAALATKNEIIIQLSIEELAKTERNFILKKGESTIEIEKERIEIKNSKNIIDALKDIIKTK
ncbi:hypothetical protein [uncultured Chryseobacterium sp.]|uniref:hypothetical protein n=1 Tax=uncultured Chryseobacterium sp. TaxID=259322 RepID=UPI0025894273|nr:hypothetical protein [uncultured Chryseobacterium sp.]